MKVLLIDNYDSFTFNLVQLINQMQLCDLEIRSYDDVDEPYIEKFDKFIISPGPGIPSDFPKLEQYVKRFYKQKDILGICLGHEAIALAFGGAIHFSGEVFHGFTKKTRILDPHNYVFRGIPDNFDAGCYHSWVLTQDIFPDDLLISAVAHDGVIMALQHKKYNVVGFQYHPESIMTKEGKRMVRNWLAFNS